MKSLINDLREVVQQVGGEVISINDASYHKARRVYNRIHDLYPHAIVRCMDQSSLSEIIRITQEYHVPLALRGGGHHIAGFSTCEAGVVIDFSSFRKVEIDQNQTRVIVQPGTQLGDVDSALCPHGFVIPTGTVSKTGITGLTLGGGIGWLIGKYGLACDQLIGVDAVLANGDSIHASESEYTDLLWASRGGGGNFGILTKLYYKFSPLPMITTGSAVVSIDSAKEVLGRLFSSLEQLPESLTIAPILRTSGDSSAPVCAIDFCVASDEQVHQQILLMCQQLRQCRKIEVNLTLKVSHREL